MEKQAAVKHCHWKREILRRVMRLLCKIYGETLQAQELRRRKHKSKALVWKCIEQAAESDAVKRCAAKAGASPLHRDRQECAGQGLERETWFVMQPRDGAGRNDLKKIHRKDEKKRNKLNI